MGHVGEFFPQLQQLFHADALSFPAAAAGADLADDSGVAAHRVPVHRMVHRAVAHAGFLHAADDGLKGGQVAGGVAVHFHVGDVAGIGQGVVGRFPLDLIKGADVVIDRYMEAVGVVIPVGDALDLAEDLLVDADEAAGQALRRSGQQGEVEAGGLGLLVAALAHMADDLQAQLLGLVAFAVVDADQGLQGLGQADEAHGQGAVAQDVGHGIVRPQGLGIHPHALAHEEGIIAHLFAALDLEAVEQLAEDQVDALIQHIVELVQVALGLQAQSRQVDGGEGQVAPAAGDLAAGIVDVADDPGAAAHVGHFRVEVALFIILQIVGCVQEGEIGEQALGRGGHGQTEQVVVGIARIVADPLLDLEDLHREDGRLAVAQTGHGGVEQVADDHAAFGAGIGAVVDGGKGHLGAGPGIHGVQVMHQGFHGLIGGLVRFKGGCLGRPPVQVGGLGEIAASGQQLGDPFAHGLILAEADLGLRIVLQGLQQVLGGLGLQIQGQGEELGQGLEVFLAEGLGHARSHGIVKIGDGLAAVHLVLVGLDGDAAQGGVALDGIGGPQIAVTGGEAAPEEAGQVDLAAGLGEHIEILVVDVDIAVDMGGGYILGQDVVVHEILGALGAVFEHGAHGGISVDVGVFPLQVGVLGVGEGQLLVDVHQVGLGLTDLGVLGPVEDVSLGYLGVTGMDQLLLHQVLHVLHRGQLAGADAADDGRGQLVQLVRGQVILGRGDAGLAHGVFDFFRVKADDGAVALADGGRSYGNGHELNFPSMIILAPSRAVAPAGPVRGPRG